MDRATQTRIENYQPAAAEIASIKDVPTDILVGITGAGKNTIMNDVLHECPDGYERVVTSTTRQPRKNNGIMERDGEDYHFLTLDQARGMMQRGEYIEVAEVNNNIYGSLFSEYRRIASLGRCAIGDVDYQGATNYLSFTMSQLSVYFVVPPDFATWAARLAGRNGRELGRDEDTLRRLHSAQKELAAAQTNKAFIPIINDVSSETARHIIEYRRTNTGPSNQEVAEARAIITSLGRSIDRYLHQVEAV